MICLPSRLVLYSPCTRGSTGCAVSNDSPVIVFPAHAGVHHSLGRLRPCSSHIPRVCGGGPGWNLVLGADHAYSSHTWGWTWHCPYRRRQRDVFPTCVGVDPSSRRCNWTPTSIPCVRGGGPTIWAWIVGERKYSPCTRGSTLRLGHRARLPPIFPTHVGVDRLAQTAHGRSLDIPRVCGGLPPSRKTTRLQPRYSPRTRGSTCALRPFWVESNIFPVYAGVHLGCILQRLPTEYIPRVHGGLLIYPVAGNSLTRLLVAPHHPRSKCLRQASKPYSSTIPVKYARACATPRDIK